MSVGENTYVFRKKHILECHLAFNLPICKVDAKAEVTVDGQATEKTEEAIIAKKHMPMSCFQAP